MIEDSENRKHDSAEGICVVVVDHLETNLLLEILSERDSERVFFDSLPLLMLRQLGCCQMQLLTKKRLVLETISFFRIECLYIFICCQ